MSTEQLAEMIEKLPPERRALIVRLIEELAEPAPAAPVPEAGEVGILKWAGRFHLGGPIGSLTAEELHEDD